MGEGIKFYSLDQTSTKDVDEGVRKMIHLIDMYNKNLVEALNRGDIANADHWAEVIEGQSKELRSAVRILMWHKIDRK